MTQSKLLVDTNTYIRLAKTIRPLLFIPFGKDKYCLYILPELNNELSNRRLSSKFHWLSDDEYEENRKTFLNVGKKQRNEIDESLKFIWDYVISDIPTVSRVDAIYVAYAYELGIPVITDDQDMTELANAFDVDVMSTLALLKIMLDNKHTDLKTIKGLVDYWKFEGDCPANLHRDLKRFFPDL